MSHFSVLVILSTEPTDETIAAALQPFHEYECTGIDDQYVVDVDMTDEVNAAWLEPAKAVRLADGSLHSRWDDKFYTSPADDSDRFDTRPTFVLPEGAIETEVPRNELGEYAGIVAFATEDRGYIERDGRFYRHTNPNSHWDWYQLGGRYSGKLRTLTGDRIKGQPGLAGSQEDPNGADVAQRSDIDSDTMRRARIDARAQWLGKIRSKSGLNTDELDRALRLQPTVSAAWQALDTKPRGTEYHNWVEANFGDDGRLLVKASAAVWELPTLGRHPDSAAWAKAAPALTAWAVVKDGVWTEKGSMGWWGMASDEKDQDEWDAQVSALVDNLPADHWLAVVDCHI